MSKIHERISIACPLTQANRRIGDFFRAHGNREGDMARLILSFPFPGSPEPMQRSVIATMHPLHVPGEMTPHYRIEWAPEEPGPYPLFAGTLVVDSDENYENFFLELDGKYTPPLGLFGKGFDMVVGKHIADATANELLKTVKNFIESDFQADEMQKQKAA